MKYSLKFSLSFVETIDSIFQTIYSESATREAFFKLYYLMDTYSIYEKDRKSASIHNTVIRKLLGSTRINKKKIQIATKVIELSVEHNIITYSNHHFDKVNSSKNYTRVYKYTDFLAREFSDKCIDVEIDKESYLFIKQEHARPTLEHLQLQYDLLKSDRLQFDYTAAMNWLHTIKPTLNENQERCYNRMILNMADRRITTIEDPKSKRIFTNITLMKKELRQFITIDNEPLVEIDLKSSQPYLLASLILNENPENKDSEYFFNTIVNEDIYMFFYHKWIEINGASTYTNFNNINYETEIEDITVFTNGIFDYDLTRHNSKKQFMRLLFKKVNGSVPYQVVLKTLFPEVYKTLQLLKTKYEKVSEDHNLAVELQLIESNIFLPVEHKYAKKGSLSCHDGIYSKQSLTLEIVEALNNQFASKGYNKYNLKTSLTV